MIELIYEDKTRELEKQVKEEREEVWEREREKGKKKWRKRTNGRKEVM